MHNYYPNFREQYRHPHRKRLLKEELPMMQKLEEEERPTYFQRMSRDSGLLGLSVLHRLYPLYGFDVLRDTSLMLCTCCLLMLSRIILRDGLLRVIWTKSISTLICQKCRGLLVINDIMFSTTYNYLVRKSVKWSTFQARVTSHFGGTGKSFNYTFS